VGTYRRGVLTERYDKMEMALSQDGPAWWKCHWIMVSGETVCVVGHRVLYDSSCYFINCTGYIASSDMILMNDNWEEHGRELF
jgi:hypothetical protein